jgi:tetratricopeptide (TPR) repeat protein
MGHRCQAYRSVGARKSGPRSPLAVLVCAVLAALIATTAAPATARADKPASPQARAAELFKSSADAYRDGNFQRTADLLKEAYGLDPQPVLLYNLGRAYEGLGDVDAAIATYEKYLAADPKTRDRGAIEQRLTTLRRQRDEKGTLEKQRDEERRRAEETAKAAAEEQERQRQREAKRDKEPRRRSVGPYIVGGVGVAGLAAGAVVGLMATSAHDSATSERVQKTAIDQQDDAKTYATVSTVSFVAGGVLLAAGVTWWFLDRPRTSPTTTTASTRLGVRPGGLVLEGAF